MLGNDFKLSISYLWNPISMLCHMDILNVNIVLSNAIGYLECNCKLMHQDAQLN